METLLNLGLALALGLLVGDRRGSRLVVGLAACESRCHLLDSFADRYVYELTRVDDALTGITQGKIRCLPVPFYYLLDHGLHGTLVDQLQKK